MITRREFQLFCLAGLWGRGRASGVCGSTTSLTSSATWPQWGGVNRNFSAPPLANGDTLPAPQFVWKRDLGKGHAAIVSNGEYAYTLCLEGEQEVLEKWRANTGERVWAYKDSVSFHASIAEYDGPHATPLLLENQILTVGIDARVRAIAVATGRVLWTRDLRTDVGTILPQSGYAASPLVWQQRLIIPTLGNARSEETERYEPSVTGAEQIPGAVALDTRTGAEVWRTESFRSSHASPIIIDFSGQPIAVFHGMFELVGIDPRDGTVLWKEVLRTEAADNVAFTPIWDADRSQVLISHGYCDRGTQSVQLERSGGTWQTHINWTNSRLRIVHTNAVLIGTTLLGTGRSTVLVAVDVRDGRTIFRQRGFGKSNLITAGSQLLILDEGGDLVGGQLREEKIEEIWRSRVLTSRAWTVPSIVGKLLLLRDLREVRAYRF